MSKPWDAELVTTLREQAKDDEYSGVQETQIWAAQEIERLGAKIERLTSERDELLTACRECLKVVDDAYDATGFFRVAKTSEQRMRIEAAIAKATGEPGR